MRLCGNWKEAAVQPKTICRRAKIVGKDDELLFSKPWRPNCMYVYEIVIFVGQMSPN